MRCENHTTVHGLLILTLHTLFSKITADFGPSFFCTLSRVAASPPHDIHFDQIKSAVKYYRAASFGRQKETRGKCPNRPMATCSFFVRNINLSHIWSHRSHLVTLVTSGPIGQIGQIWSHWSHSSHLVTSGHIWSHRSHLSHLVPSVICSFA